MTVYSPLKICPFIKRMRTLVRMIKISFYKTLKIPGLQQSEKHLLNKIKSLCKNSEFAGVFSLSPSISVQLCETL